MQNYTLQEAADELALSTVTLRKYIKSGRLMAYKRGPRDRGPGGGYVITHDDLQMFRRWYETLTGVRG